MKRTTLVLLCCLSGACPIFGAQADDIGRIPDSAPKLDLFGTAAAEVQKEAAVQKEQAEPVGLDKSYLTANVPLPPPRPGAHKPAATITTASLSPAPAVPVVAALVAPEPITSGGVADLIARHAAEQGVPVGLARAVVRIESRFNPRAHNGPNMGLTQINLGTARALGYSGPATGLYDADTNLRYGIRYLAMAYKLAGGDTCRTVLKYQAGHRAVSMTRAASIYCAKVRTIMAAH